MRRLPRKARPNRKQERQHWLEGPPRSEVRAQATAWELTRQGSRWRAGASRPSAGLRCRPLPLPGSGRTAAPPGHVPGNLPEADGGLRSTRSVQQARGSRGRGV